MSETRSILHVVDRIDGGVPRAVRSYIEHSPAEFEHQIIAPFSDGRPARVWAGLDVMQHDLGDGLLRRVTALRAAVARLEPDVVHAHSSFSGLYARAFRSGVPIVYQPHCFKHDDPKITRFHRWGYRSVERALARRTARFAVLSQHEGELVRELDRNASVILLPNLPTVPAKSAVPREHRQDPRATVIMTGRIAAQKDPAFYRDVAQLLRESLPSVRMRWIGDGSTEERAKLINADIDVSGWLAANEVALALASSDVYVHTATYEGFPLSVLDAAICDVPIVVRSIDALADSGLLQAESAQGVADLVLGVLAEPELRAHARNVNRTLLSRMNPTGLQKALHKLYDQNGAQD